MSSIVWLNGLSDIYIPFICEPNNRQSSLNVLHYYDNANLTHYLPLTATSAAARRRQILQTKAIEISAMLIWLSSFDRCNRNSPITKSENDEFRLTARFSWVSHGSRPTPFLHIPEWCGHWRTCPCGRHSESATRPLLLILIERAHTILRDNIVGVVGQQQIIIPVLQQTFMDSR